MILKKPYAFLIKYFKAIHFILFILIGIISFNYMSIVSFFSDYNSGKITPVQGIAGQYVKTSIFILIIFVIVFSVFMFLLMNKKKKPKLFYIFLCLYYLIILVLMLYSYQQINSLYDITLTQQASRAYKDIFLISSFPNYYFLILSFIRSVGFDVKKFNFKKDLDELQIKSEDNEEFEFILGTDGFKYKRKIKRISREIKYYFLENKMIIITIFAIFLGFCGAFYIINNQFINKTYGVLDRVTSEGIDFTLNGSYVTQLNSRGSILKTEKKYIVVDLNLLNNSNKVKSITSDKIFLSCEENNFYNKTSVKDSFSDLGIVYSGNNLRIGTNYKYLLTFEVGNSIKCNNYYLNIFKSISYKKDNKIEYNYYQFIIRPTVLDTKMNEEKKDLNEVMYLGNQVYLNSSLKIERIEFKNSYEYEYNYCQNNSCRNLIDVEKPENSSNQILLVVKYDLILNENSKIYDAIGNSNPASYVLNKIIGLTYTINDKTYYKTLLARTNSNIPNILFMDVNRNILDYNEIILSINTREKHFYIPFIK